MYEKILVALAGPGGKILGMDSVGKRKLLTAIGSDGKIGDRGHFMSFDSRLFGLFLFRPIYKIETGLPA